MSSLTQQEFQDLKEQGYTPQQINQAMLELEQDEAGQIMQQSEQMRMNDPRSYSQMSSFAGKPDENFAKWQLELNDILERAEHILRGDMIKFVEGRTIWVKSESPQNNPLNEMGIYEIMKLLAIYINRNTILSDYDNDEINFKMLDFGKRLNNFIFMKYDELGLDSEDKRKNYEIIVGEIVDLVHSAYKRALNGGERRSLREMIQISQNTSQQTMMPVQNAPKERSILNPMRIFGKINNA
jgi:hypothetical protein